VVPLTDRLEERGYVQRVPDRADRRVMWLELTVAGEEFVRGLFRPARAELLAAVATFTPEERATFARLLDRNADHLEEPHTRPDQADQTDAADTTQRTVTASR
jgi:DNA-binding MarR family transcriptional regulator